MKMTVMGAGAVGCYCGGMLTRVGHDVTLIARPHHVEAVERVGLLLNTQSFTAQVPMRASTQASAVAGAALVLFCVKSTDTERAAALMRPHLLAGTLLLTLQNGVDNADRLQAALPQHEVAAAVVSVATEMSSPGRVRHHGRGELVIAASRRSMEIAAMLIQAGVPTQFLSTAQDLARGKRSEADRLNGHVMRRGQALALPTPANRVLHTLVKLLEGCSAVEARSA